MAEAQSSSGVRRKGARRMSEIPAGVLRRLNSGEAESVTLVELLAIDSAKLARAVGLSRVEAERISQTMPDDAAADAARLKAPDRG